MPTLSQRIPSPYLKIKHLQIKNKKKSFNCKHPLKYILC